MSKKSSAPAGPDWGQLIASSDRMRQQNRRMFDKYMAFERKQYKDQKKINKQILDIQLPAMREEAELAGMLRDRYKEMGIPFENEYFDKLSTWDSETRRDERAGQAQAGIGMAADAARESELRRLEGYGIDPSQTRSAALDSSLRMQEAISKAAAGNNQRNLVEQEGLQYGGAAVDLMRGGQSMSQASLAAATGSGAAAMGSQQGIGQYMGNAYGRGAGMMGQGHSMLTSAYGTAGNLHQGDLARHEMDQKYSAGNMLGNLFGTGLGAAAAGGWNPFSAEGGPVRRAEGGPSAPMAHPRAPQSGIPQDNIPALLSADEFVIPDDVAKWEGQKALNKMINKAREDIAATDQQRAMNQQAMGIPA